MSFLYELKRKSVYFPYYKFFNKIKKIGEKNYRKDIKKFYLKKGDNLTKLQIREIKQYWSKYKKNIDINFHKYYINRTGVFDVKYIPDYIYINYIDPYFNNRELEAASSDKNYLDTRLNGFNLPKTYIHKINDIYLDDNYEIINIDTVVEKLTGKTFVAKPSMFSFGGQNISFFKNCQRQDIIKYLEECQLENIIFQEMIVQNEATAYLHEKSLNTLRIITLIIENEVIVLKPIIRIVEGDERVGREGIGEVFIGINEDGTLTNYGYDIFGNRFEEEFEGKPLKNVIIPEIKEAKEMCKKAAQRFPHFRLISWDVAIDKDNKPVIIEANLNMGNIDIVQPIWGPFFGEYTDKVLNEVFINKKKYKPSFNIDVYI